MEGQHVGSAPGAGDQRTVPPAIDALLKRCSDAGIGCQLHEPDIGLAFYVVTTPCGRDKRSIYVHSDREAERLLDVPFERYTLLADYVAICSYQEGTIEAAIRPLGPMPSSFVFRRLLGRDMADDQIDAQALSIELKRSQPAATESVRIGPMSRAAPSLLISGLHVTQHDQAVAILERVANSLFFEIDLSLGLALSLARDRNLTHRGRPQPRPKDKPELHFPTTEYEGGPMALYWYARSAIGMPLLQFLAYYQAIEFYFPIYSRSEAHRTIGNILKDPSFNPHREPDLSRLLNAIKVTSGPGFGDERSQLRVTLQECLDANALREFLSEEQRRQFFTGKQKTFSAHKLPVANPTADLRGDVADRIYDIRCMIVHTKSTAGDGEVELLLPFSREAESLGMDIELIQYVARQVIIAGGGPLHI